jgi:uncharacterized repeat protein (TIGR01451 family)
VDVPPGGSSGGPGTSPTPGPGSGIQLTDPIITKHVEPPFALPGESVVWTITVTNPGPVAASNIVVEDSMPPEIEILSVSASAGKATFSGQKVKFTLSSLAAGASATVTINARVRGNTKLPYVLCNTASLTSPVNQSAEACVASVGRLPNTGESPWTSERLPLLALIVGVVGLALLLVNRARRLGR